MKHKLRGKIIVKFVELKAKTYSCLIDDKKMMIKKQKAQKSVS